MRAVLMMASLGQGVALVHRVNTSTILFYP
jgi:hypothetical protein